MSRISKLINQINKGVEQGVINEDTKKELLNTRISSKLDITKLEEKVSEYFSKK